ncbi:MAG: methyltransferase domain-containing protein [Chloroflexi bacterium]|nr:methyltransferase domain-containing protein [Chloroflexota bacterium]
MRQATAGRQARCRLRLRRRGRCDHSARLVGTSGRVIGVDMTPAMPDAARRAAAAAHLENVELREGYLEALPIEDAWADVVISNGVLNLVPDKAAALAEIHRVLRPGGRLQIADIILDRPVSEGRQPVDRVHPRRRRLRGRAAALECGGLRRHRRRRRDPSRCGQRKSGRWAVADGG